MADAGGGGLDRLGRKGWGLGQRPERRGARARPAIAENRRWQRRQRPSEGRDVGVADLAGRHRDVQEPQPVRHRRRLDRRSRRLAVAFAVRPQAEDGPHALRRGDADVGNAELRRDRKLRRDALDVHGFPPREFFLVFRPRRQTARGVAPDRRRGKAKPSIPATMAAASTTRRTAC